MGDILTRGVSKAGHIMATACRTTDLVNEARNRHGLWPAASAALGRTLSAAAMMASQLKYENSRLEIQIDGGGPLGKIIADARPNGDVRGYVENPHVHAGLKDGGGIAVGPAVGNDGMLRVFKDMGMKEPFVGTVDLRTGEIGEDLTYYFAISEQIPSAVGLGVLVDTDNSMLSAGGWIVQMMPEATEEEICAVEENVRKMPHISALLREGKTPLEIIRMIVPDYVEMETMPLQWKCTCSRERSEGVLRSLRMKELKEILEEDKQCDMHCDFCGETYHFSEEELQKIYNDRLKEIAGKLAEHDTGMENR